MPDSSTGGYLPPTDVSLEGEPFTDFLHDVIAGITSIAGELVRPGWQEDPPPTPDIDVDWVSFRVTDQVADANPYQQQDDENGSTLIRHERFSLLCIFYGPEAQANAGHLRDGLYITQNTEQLFLAGMGLVGPEPILTLSEEINGRYFNRADITIDFNREIKRGYPILSFVGASGLITADRGNSTLTRTWEA